MGLNPEIISNYNIHLHVPEGATPKEDGLVLV
jgi:ATP-dependent Lon protease